MSQTECLCDPTSTIPEVIYEASYDYRLIVILNLWFL